jgi:hypothetical protein
LVLALNKYIENHACLSDQCNCFSFPKGEFVHSLCILFTILSLFVIGTHRFPLQALFPHTCMLVFALSLFTFSHGQRLHGNLIGLVWLL